MKRTSVALKTGAFLSALVISLFVQIRPESLSLPVRAATIDLRVSTASDPDPRDETSIAVSPVDSRFIVAASKVIVGGAANPFSGVSRVAYYFSQDGGNTWGQALLGLETPEKVFTRATNPSVAADLDGNFYIAALMLDTGTFDNGVYVFKSVDGGRTFFETRPAFVDLSNPTNPVVADKCYLTVDTSPTSPFRNTLYAVFTNTDYGPTGFPRTVIKISQRRPGAVGFSTPKIISHEGDMRGPTVSTGPGGEVYAAWEGIGNPRVILFNASTDGGQTWLPLLIAPSIDYNVHNFVGSLSLPGPPISIDAVPRANSFPVIDVDRSAGPNRGMIYIAYAESVNGIDSDVFIKRMPPPNGGAPAVGFPTRVNNDAGGAHQFFPWLSVDDTDGSINVCFYDRRDDPLLLSVYLGRSTNGGGSFENVKISSAQSDPRIQSTVLGANRSAIGIGDRIGLKMQRGLAALAWTDTRSGKQEIFFGRVDYGTGGGGGTPPNDLCQGARVIASLPFSDSQDISTATSSPDDPPTCANTVGSNTVWYSLTSPADTFYGIDTAGSSFDTVLSVYTGSCGSLVQMACSDDFGHGAGNNSVVVFQARAGTRYFIEVAAKGTGGVFNLRVGYPTVTSVEYGFAPDESRALQISGAGFLDANTQVIVRRGGVDEALPTTFYGGSRQSDGSFGLIYGFRKKIKKILPPGEPVLVIVKSPVAGDLLSVPYQFVR
ncbi:MAG TPA: hypothetical protein VFV34_13535 [Blastocatellia bacterium]|nr:hypothetical protein [Blastocatellia bacterium]